jgi:FixJ family two-component response regulator
MVVPAKAGTHLPLRAVPSRGGGRENVPVGILKHVAIVDDDPSLCRSLGRLLRLAGYEPCAFHSAEDFLGDEGRDRFACVLADIQLGGMSGLEMHRALCQRGEAVPVIFITAHDEPAARTEAVRGGCAAFFSKTEDGTRILEAIRHVSGG